MLEVAEIFRRHGAAYRAQQSRQRVLGNYVSHWSHQPNVQIDSRRAHTATLPGVVVQCL